MRYLFTKKWFTLIHVKLNPVHENHILVSAPFLQSPSSIAIIKKKADRGSDFNRIVVKKKKKGWISCPIIQNQIFLIIILTFHKLFKILCCTFVHLQCYFILFLLLFIFKRLLKCQDGQAKRWPYCLISPDGHRYILHVMHKPIKVWQFSPIRNKSKYSFHNANWMQLYNSLIIILTKKIVLYLFKQKNAFFDNSCRIWGWRQCRKNT